MGAVWVAWATAVELSDRTLRAAAKLTGAATLALMSDMAARSGSASPARPSSSSRVSLRYSCSLLTGLPPSGAHVGAKPNAVTGVSYTGTAAVGGHCVRSHIGR